MAYQSIGTSRFYVNILEWIDSLGVSMGTSMKDHYRTLPVTPYIFDSIPSYNLPFAMSDKTFVAILGHDLGTDDDSYYTVPGWEVVTEVVNGHDSIQYNGFSLSICDGTGINPFSIGFGESTYNTALSPVIGSIVFGTYYDMPHSAEIKMTLGRELNGIKRTRTPGGSDLVSHAYTRPAPWGEAGAWELTHHMAGTDAENWPPLINHNLSRVGRRTWSLSFNALKKSDLFASVNSLTTFGDSEYVDGNDDNVDTSDTLLHSDTFFSQVLLKTNGGQNAFLFQEDKNNFHHDSFAIAKFDMKSYRFRQISNEVFSISVDIKAVW